MPKDTTGANLVLDDIFGPGKKPETVVVSDRTPEDYFANTQEAINKHQNVVLEKQAQEVEASHNRLEKISEANKKANEAIYSAEYSNQQMTDKFGWSGGQIMDSQTRMQSIRDQAASEVMSNEKFLDSKYSTGMDKAYLEAVNERMESAMKASEDAYTRAVATAELTGFYIDPVAGDRIGRYHTIVNQGMEVPTELKDRLIELGFGDSAGNLDREALNAMGAVMETITREQWDTALEEKLLEMDLAEGTLEVTDKVILDQNPKGSEELVVTKIEDLDVDEFASTEEKEKKLLTENGFDVNLYKEFKDLYEGFKDQGNTNYYADALTVLKQKNSASLSMSDWVKQGHGKKEYNKYYQYLFKGTGATLPKFSPTLHSNGLPTENVSFSVKYDSKDMDGFLNFLSSKGVQVPEKKSVFDGKAEIEVNHRKLEEIMHEWRARFN